MTMTPLIQATLRVKSIIEVYSSNRIPYNCEFAM